KQNLESNDWGLIRWVFTTTFTTTLDVVVNVAKLHGGYLPITFLCRTDPLNNPQILQLFHLSAYQSPTN
ncbi:MAG: hypothetical protein FWE48_07665, partial [Coriobacteriia bacterium]|nr:hypothetical protein [Coriobacteriia bacterium]